MMCLTRVLLVVGLTHPMTSRVLFPSISSLGKFIFIGEATNAAWESRRLKDDVFDFGSAVIEPYLFRISRVLIPSI